MSSEQTAAAVAAPEEKKSHRPGKRLVRRIIVIVLIAALLALAVWGGIRLFGGEKEDDGVMTATVTVGSIVSTVSGEGLTRAKDSAALTLITGGTVQEVFVKEGDRVEAGQQLYRIRSDTAQQAVADAQRQVNSCANEIRKLEEAQTYLNVKAPFAGKLLDVTIPNVGDELSAGVKLATLVDDSRFTLVQYFSYAYADRIHVGQSARISIPSSMVQLDGVVTDIYMVDRISAEGTRLFEVDFSVPNPGTLTAGVAAGATLTAGGEIIYPYELGQLAYHDSVDVITRIGGKVQRVDLRAYASVTAGQSLLVMSGDDSDTELFRLNSQLQTAKKTLDDAQQALNMLGGISPIAGTVMSIGAQPGDTVASGVTMAVVSDSSTILLDAGVDERNIAAIKEGMDVDVDQWGTSCYGVVTAVGLTSKVEQGVARFPVTISIDNSDGRIMPGSYATYTLIASQSEDCMVLPIQAVKYAETADGTQTVVFVRSERRPDEAIELDVAMDGVPERGYWPVPVSVGISDRQNVEILDGVEPGTEVFQQVIYTSEY